MNDQSEAAIAASEVHKHLEQFFTTLGAAMRFMLAMRILWMKEEADRLEREAKSLEWKAGHEYVRAVCGRSDAAMKQAS